MPLPLNNPQLAKHMRPWPLALNVVNLMSYDHETRQPPGKSKKLRPPALSVAPQNRDLCRTRWPAAQGSAQVPLNLSAPQNPKPRGHKNLENRSREKFSNLSAQLLRRTTFPSVRPSAPRSVLPSPHHRPQLPLPRTIGDLEARGSKVPKLRCDRLVAIIARLLRLAEAGDVTVDPAVECIVEGGRNRAA